MFGKILLPLDGSELADRVLGWVDQLLRDQRVGVVTLLRVVNPDSDDSAAAEDHLKAVRKRLSEHEIPTSIHVERGKPSEKILELAADHDLVAMSTHGRSGLKRLLRGSVAEQVLRACPTPLLLINPHTDLPSGTAPFQRILVPVDSGDYGARILPVAGELARVYGAKIILFRVENFAVEDGLVTQLRLRSQEEVLASLEPLADGLRQLDLEVECQAALGDPRVEMLDLLERDDADLVAMATHGRAGLQKWWFGSVAEALVRHSPKPLFLHRWKA